MKSISTAEICPICSGNTTHLSLAFSNLRHYEKVESCHFCLSPVQQVGPSCGIAALCSALSSISLKNDESETSPSFSQLLSKAVSNSWSNFGEMFDALSLSHLAVLDNKSISASVVSLRNDFYSARSVIVSHLHQQHPVLIAYDCDADFYPKFCKGKKAHWAVLNGFCVGFSKCHAGEPKFRDVSKNIDQSEKMYQNALDSVQDNIYLWTLQGKSALFRTFEALELIKSNFQLATADCSLFDKGFKVPLNGDITNTLAHKVVVLSCS